MRTKSFFLAISDLKGALLTKSLFMIQGFGLSTN